MPYLLTFDDDASASAVACLSWQGQLSFLVAVLASQAFGLVLFWWWVERQQARPRHRSLRS